ncbi:hypothetical protein FRC00_002735 [Tulasnella sp. 408]|nr:hypothetical protein FRC00_002735 [Tulasnella sp. 408]
MYRRLCVLQTRVSKRSYASTSASHLDKWPGWETVIGIEVHAQIKSRQKLFSESLNSNDEPPNTHVSLFDAAFPGTLPRLNKYCVDLAIRTALALNSTVQPKSAFDRKHYFYRDLPSGYQITQNYGTEPKSDSSVLGTQVVIITAPLATGGFLYLDKAQRRVGLKQIQLEQDTAKSTYEQSLGATQIDLNRAGAGLMEIVSQPDMRSPEEAAAYVRTLQALLRSVGASDGNMEQGSLRCDVNVSVNRAGEPFGTRCEIKNLNSIKAVQVAITSEVYRHIDLIERGLSVPQETRGFDEERAETFKLRSKEDAPDYRYMPDPNLPPVLITEAHVDKVRQTMPELPTALSTRLQNDYGLTERQAEVLMSVDSGVNIGYDGEVAPPGAVPYFEEVARGRDPKVVVNWITQELLAQLSRLDEPFSTNPIPPSALGELIDLLQAGKITGTSAKTLIRHIFNSPPGTGPLSSVSKLVDDLGLRATSADLQSLCEQAISLLSEEADLVRKGNEKVLMKIVGQVMKLSKGTADGKAARALLHKMLKTED